MNILHIKSFVNRRESKQRMNGFGYADWGDFPQNRIFCKQMAHLIFLLGRHLTLQMRVKPLAPPINMHTSPKLYPVIKIPLCSGCSLMTEAHQDRRFEEAVQKVTAEGETSYMIRKRCRRPLVALNLLIWVGGKEVCTWRPHKLQTGSNSSTHFQSVPV